MSVNGPIEFVRDRVGGDKKGPTEFGGDAGLVQVGGRISPGGNVSAFHEPSASERRGVLVRAVGAVKVDPLVAGGVVDDPAGQAVDPLTGLGVGDDWNLSGTSGSPVDVPPATERG